MGSRFRISGSAVAPCSAGVGFSDCECRVQGLRLVLSYIMQFVAIGGGSMGIVAS